MVSSPEHVVVVGGGVIGAMSAWYLSQAGAEVTLVDKGEFASACSHGNCGYVCPSHVLPLAQPGAMRKTLRAMLRRNSPFAIKPRLSPSFASWFWNFSRACNERKMLSVAADLHGVLQCSLELYRDLIASEGIECEWQERGLLFVYDNPRELDEFAPVEALVRERFGVGAKRYDGASLRELEPALNEVCAGAWHYEGDCHLRPDRLLAELRQRLERRGVRIVEQTEMRGLRREGGAVVCVDTDSGSIDGDAFVVATGAWTPLLKSELGVRVPIQPGKGYSITTSAPNVMPRHPLIFEDSHVAITPMGSRYRIGSTMEFVGYDASINRKRLRLLTDSASKHLVEPVGATIIEEWAGWRPMIWDGKPVIDRAPVASNVWVAAGHGMLGLSMGTGTGRLVADLVTGAEPLIDPAPFAASRF